MMSFNLVVLAGHVGRDPETKEIEGTIVTSFTLAVDTYKGRNESGKAKDEPLWVRVNVWGKLAETASAMVKKGMPVLVSGELQIRRYTD
jgi:single-strand DNA-binding protein